MSKVTELNLDNPDELDLDLDLEEPQIRRPKAKLTRGKAGNKKSKLPLYAGGGLLLGAAIYLGSSMLNVSGGLSDDKTVEANAKPEPTFSEIISSAVDDIRGTVSDQGTSLDSLGQRFSAIEKEFDIYKDRIISHDERLDSQDALISKLGDRISDAEKQLIGMKKNRKVVKRAASIRKIRTPKFPYQVDAINSLGSTNLVSLFVNGSYSMIEMNEKMGNWKLVKVSVKESKATFLNLKTNSRITIKV